jgi:hypothetical protein
MFQKFEINGFIVVGMTQIVGLIQHPLMSTLSHWGQSGTNPHNPNYTYSWTFSWFAARFREELHTGMPAEPLTEQRKFNHKTFCKELCPSFSKTAHNCRAEYCRKDAKVCDVIAQGCPSEWPSQFAGPITGHAIKSAFSLYCARHPPSKAPLPCDGPKGVFPAEGWGYQKVCK